MRWNDRSKIQDVGALGGRSEGRVHESPFGSFKKQWIHSRNKRPRNTGYQNIFRSQKAQVLTPDATLLLKILEKFPQLLPSKCHKLQGEARKGSRESWEAVAHRMGYWNPTFYVRDGAHTTGNHCLKWWLVSPRREFMCWSLMAGSPHEVYSLLGGSLSCVSCLLLTLPMTVCLSCLIARWSLLVWGQFLESWPGIVSMNMKTKSTAFVGRSLESQRPFPSWPHALEAAALTLVSKAHRWDRKSKPFTLGSVA